MNTSCLRTGRPLLAIPREGICWDAAGGLAVWARDVGLVGVGEEYPRQWLRDLEKRGLDTNGIRTLQELQNVDLRSFIAFNENNERSYTNAGSLLDLRAANSHFQNHCWASTRQPFTQRPARTGTGIARRSGCAEGISGCPLCAYLPL